MPSVSPDVAAECACAAAIRESLPQEFESGFWPLADGRPVVWALHRGMNPDTVILLGHYDTVGIDEYASLGAPEGKRVALRPDALRRILLERGPRELDPADETLRMDLEEERAKPGTWLFGRGALDMKSGLAAGIAAMESLAERGSDDGGGAGSVLFVACPDEENLSAGMIHAAGELIRLRAERGLRYLGAINLDSSTESALYLGVAGKSLVGAWVLGVPSHAGEPEMGVDAAQIASHLVTMAASAPELREPLKDRSGPAPSVLRLRDLRSRYDVQTTLEATVEFNVIVHERSLEQILETFRGVAERALQATPRPASAAPPREGTAASSVLTYSELSDRAGQPLGEDPLPSRPERADARERTLERVRRLAQRARIGGPAIVLYLLPPHYPSAAPGSGPLVEAGRRVAGRGGLSIASRYPFISDASYLSWRVELPRRLGEQMPAWGREYDLPIETIRMLDLDVINLGPWGRGMHGRFERVHAPYAFGTLPGLISQVIEEAFHHG